MTCKRLHPAHPAPISTDHDPPPSSSTLFRLFQPRSSFHHVGLETAYIVSARSVRIPSVLSCALEYIIVLFPWERERIPGRERGAREREGEAEKTQEGGRERERESEARPSWLSLAHLLDAIQSMRGLDLVPPPQTAHIYTPRDIYRGALHRRDKDTNSTVPSAQVHDPFRRPLRPPCDSSPSSLTPFSAFCR